MLDKIIKHIDSHRTELRTLSDALWNHPETAYNEHFSSKTAAELLKKCGYAVTLPCYGIETAFRSEFAQGSGGPVFAIASEYDALPEIGHGCGHNLICTAGIAAFIAAAEFMKEEGISGKVILLGTPAEEGGGGKVKMAAAGCLEGVDAAIMTHPSGINCTDEGSTANCGLEVIFHGKAAHAAAAPEKGINALDAVNLLFAGVNTYRQYIPEHARIHGVILDGGEVPNVIPDYARCRFYLRSADESWCPILEKRFRDIVRGAELMTGATAEIAPFRPAYRARKPNTPMNMDYVESMRAQGQKVEIPAKAGRGSSDFGNFSQVVPGIHPYFAISDKSVPVPHSKEFAACAKEDFGFDNALRAAAALAHEVLRFMTDPAFREAVKADFSRR